MTMAAIDPHLAGMQLMRKTDGLNRRVSFDPADGRCDKPGYERGNQSDNNDHGQVESDLLVQPIPVRFHTTSPLVVEKLGLNACIKSMLPNLVNRSQVCGNRLEPGRPVQAY